MRISPLKKEARQSSSPPLLTPRAGDEANRGDNGIDPSKREPTHSHRTVAALEQEIKDYDKRVKDLEHQVTILQLKVRELEGNDTSHLACKIEAQSLRKDKEAAEALVAAYKEQLGLANELISRTLSRSSSKKKRKEEPRGVGMQLGLMVLGFASTLTLILFLKPKS